MEKSIVKKKEKEIVIVTQENFRLFDYLVQLSTTEKFIIRVKKNRINFEALTGTEKPLGDYVKLPKSCILRDTRKILLKALLKKYEVKTERPQTFTKTVYVRRFNEALYLSDRPLLGAEIICGVSITSPLFFVALNNYELPYVIYYENGEIERFKAPIKKRKAGRIFDSIIGDIKKLKRFSG